MISRSATCIFFTIYSTVYHMYCSIFQSIMRIFETRKQIKIYRYALHARLKNKSLKIRHNSFDFNIKKQEQKIWLFEWTRGRYRMLCGNSQWRKSPIRICLFYLCFYYLLDIFDALYCIFKLGNLWRFLCEKKEVRVIMPNVLKINSISNHSARYTMKCTVYTNDCFWSLQFT